MWRSAPRRSPAASVLRQAAGSRGARPADRPGDGADGSAVSDSSINGYDGTASGVQTTEAAAPVFSAAITMDEVEDMGAGFAVRAACTDWFVRVRAKDDEIEAVVDDANADRPDGHIQSTEAWRGAKNYSESKLI